MTRTLAVYDLGHQPYRQTLALQRAVRLAIISGAIVDDVLLLVEHDPVFTLGRGTMRSSLPLPESMLRDRGADVVDIERGGDVTWHGPGQLVGYPIVNLTRHRQDLHWYLRTVEQIVIDALASLAIPAERNPGKTGVWTRGRKIASIGIHVKQWVTLHGFALNIDPDLGWFDLIVPCGIHGVTMTSVARESAIDRNTALWKNVQSAVIASTEHHLVSQARHGSLDELTAALETRAPSGNPSLHA